MNQRTQRMSQESERMPSRPSQQQPFEDLVEYARTYARERPESAALICLGIGFLLGWRLKPW